MKKPHHNNCANWEYKTHPQIAKLRTRSEALVEVLGRNPRLAHRYGLDTRAAHRFLFCGLTPKECPKFAGNYRGSAGCKHLQRYRVGIPGDPLVGALPELVAIEMQKLELRLQQLEEAFQDWKGAAEPKPAPAEAVGRLVEYLCLALERFLTIHPYANGNGHCGRLLAWALYARQGFLPLGLPLDEHLLYDEALYRHRRGDRLQLQVVMIQALKGWGSAPAPGTVP